jgi:O-antigen ligase
LDLTYPAQHGTGRLLVLYGRLVGPLLAGYLLFDKAFAYIHLPGTPLYVGEIVLLVGALGTVTATWYLRVSIKDDPMLAMLAAYFLWGFIRFLPGLSVYGIYAVRDFALVYYCLFAFFIAAALARSPDILERLIVSLNRFVPWLLLWLPFAEILDRTVAKGFNVPFTTIPITTHEGQDVAVAAVVALGSLWLFPSGRSARSRGLWSIIAIIILALVATQSRGGLLSAFVALAVGLAFFRERMRLIVPAVAATILVIGLGTLVSFQIAGGKASQGRAFSVSQLFANVASIGGAKESGNLNGTVQGRFTLWSETLDTQVSDDRLVYGYGFGVNLAYLAGGAAVSVQPPGSDPLRSPHNSYLDVLARMGLIGLSLWIALWVGWYRRIVRGCRRLAQRGLYVRRRVAVLCLMVVTATLVGSFFNPSLEGAQAAVLMWVAFGIGLVVTSFRNGFGDRDIVLDRSTAVAGTGLSSVPIGTPVSSPRPSV